MPVAVVIADNRRDRWVQGSQRPAQSAELETIYPALPTRLFLAANRGY